MFEIQETDTYADWFARLRDERARARINARIFRLSNGNAGDAKPVGDGVSEMRIDYGPGYRIYFIRIGEVIFLLLSGGDKAAKLPTSARRKNSPNWQGVIDDDKDQKMGCDRTSRYRRENSVVSRSNL